MSWGPPGGHPGGLGRLHELAARAKTSELAMRARRPYHRPPKDERPSLLRRLLRKLNPYR